MRWLAPPLSADPKVVGRKRTVRCFAWFPTRVDDDTERPTMVWMEHYLEQQELSWGGNGYHGYGYYWSTVATHSEGLPF